MDLMQTPLGDEVRRIMDAGQGKSNAYIDAVVHTDFGDIPALRVLNYDVVREYTLQYTDETTVVLVLPAGQAAYRINGSRNSLEISLKGAPVTQHGPTPVDESTFGTQRFRAVLKHATDPTMEATTRELLQESTMDIQDFTVLEFQLFNKTMEQFSMRTCGGVYRRTAVGDLIRSLLLEQSKSIEVEDGTETMGIDMVDPKDAVLREHIVIPHGTMVYDAPGYIHKNCGGVYSAGLSYYYQDDYWYVYPTFDYKRFEEATRQLTIVQVPRHKLPSLDCTYMQEGSVVSIIATGDLTFDDDSDLRKRSTGNGVRFADASKLFEVGAEVAGNKALVSRGKQNNEFISSPQKTGLNNVALSPERISANTMYQSSQLASKEGVHIQLAWENSDPALIRPGMQTRIYYFKNGSVRQVQAVVIGIQVSTQYEGYGIVTGRYNRNTAIHLFAANEAQQAD